MANQYQPETFTLIYRYNIIQNHDQWF